VLKLEVLHVSAEIFLCFLRSHIRTQTTVLEGSVVILGPQPVGKPIAIGRGSMLTSIEREILVSNIRFNL
jgi:hypothetical protein